MPTIKINHVTRIEGHATNHHQARRCRAGGRHAVPRHPDPRLREVQEGRPYYEMPAITARICGICPVSHLLASSKACDAIMAVRIPATAAKLRELLHCAQIVQSHALYFFHLSAPDLLLGMDHDPATRNVVGLLEKHPDGRATASPCASSGRRSSSAWHASASTPRGRCPAASTRRWTRRPASTIAGRAARGHGHRCSARSRS